MKPFNLVTIAPTHYAHTGALFELKSYIFSMLLECGYDVGVPTTNNFKKDCYNIFFQSHLIGSRSTASQIPSDSIIFNTEQLEPNKISALWSENSSVYAALLARCTVWDYSLLNLPAIPHDRKSLIPLLYCDKVASPLKREHGGTLLFYGSMSPSRKETLQALRDAGIYVVTLFGVYGEARDKEMMRAWAVLNLHRDIPYIENRHQFESVRCFYPLTCGVPVISDTSIDPTAEYYRGSIFFSERDSLVETVQWLYEKQDFDKLTNSMLRTFKKTSAKSIIKDAVKQFLKSL